MMTESIIHILPGVLSLILLFLPDLIYRVAAKENVQNLLKSNGIHGHTATTKLEGEIKSNFDFIGFSSSSICFVFVVFYSLDKDEYNTYQLTGWIFVFVVIFILAWSILLIVSMIMLNKRKQPSICQKILIISAVLFNILRIMI